MLSDEIRVFSSIIKIFTKTRKNENTKKDIKKPNVIKFMFSCFQSFVLS